MRSDTQKERVRGPVNEIGTVKQAGGITRRELLIGLGATGFALAAGPVSADRIVTSSEGLVVAGSEVGAIELDDYRIVEKGRLGPGLRP